MARHESKKTPTITSDILYTDDPASGTGVGSVTWFAWLETATTFYYDHPHNPFTARAERRARGGIYWLAYRQVAGKLHKIYLGKADALTANKLSDTARQLAERATQVRLPDDKTKGNFKVQAEPNTLPTNNTPDVYRSAERSGSMRLDAYRDWLATNNLVEGAALRETLDLPSDVWSTVLQLGIVPRQKMPGKGGNYDLYGYPAAFRLTDEQRAQLYDAHLLTARQAASDLGITLAQFNTRRKVASVKPASWVTSAEHPGKVYQYRLSDVERLRTDADTMTAKQAVHAPNVTPDNRIAEKPAQTLPAPPTLSHAEYGKLVSVAINAGKSWATGSAVQRGRRHELRYYPKINELVALERAGLIRFHETTQDGKPAKKWRMELTDAGRALIEAMPPDIGADSYPLPVDIQAAKDAVKAAKQPTQNVQAADTTKHLGKATRRAKQPD